MSAFLIYAIKSAIVLTLLLLPGIFLMFREKMFRFNRMTMLAILVLSLVLPLCNLSSLSMDKVPAVQNVELELLEAGFPIDMAGYWTEEVAEQPQFPWFYIVSILYAVGVTVVMGIRLREILSMGRVIRQGSIWTKDEPEGIRIYCHAEQVAPFSWLRSIVIGEKDYQDSGREIILHEKAHILHCHSLDILLLTMVEALQWWNPFVYLLGIYLRDVHEYEADDYVLRQGVSCHAYSELVIKKAVGASSYTFANSFNHSLTKKRITMMLKSNPKQWMRSRVLYVIPVATLALSAFATSEFETAADLIEEVVQTEDKGTENTANVQVNGTENAGKNVVDVRIYANGGLSCSVNGSEEQKITPTDFMKTIAEHKNEPTVINIYSEKEMSVMKELAKSAARDNGMLQINYRQAEEGAAKGAEYKDGFEALYKFFADNMQYPENAKKQGYQGRVVVQFNVETDGSLSDIRVIRGPREDMKQEALRLVKLTSGKWMPREENGQKISSGFSLPVLFRLSNEK